MRKYTREESSGEEGDYPISPCFLKCFAHPPLLQGCEPIVSLKVHRVGRTPTRNRTPRWNLNHKKEKKNFQGDLHPHGDNKDIQEEVGGITSMFRVEDSSPCHLRYSLGSAQWWIFTGSNRVPDRVPFGVTSLICLYSTPYVLCCSPKVLCLHTALFH